MLECRRNWGEGQDKDRDADNEWQWQRLSPLGLWRTTWGCNDCAHNHPRTTTALPTAPCPTKIWHRAPATPAALPTTQDSCIPHFLGGGTPIWCAPGFPQLRSSWIGTPSPSLDSLLDICPHGFSTMAMTSPAPFSTLGNLLVSSISLFYLSIVVKMAPTPSLLFSPYHQHSDRHDNAGTVHFGPQDAHPLDGHFYHALWWFLCLQCSLQWHAFFF